MLEFVNKVVYGTRAHQNTWGECHRLKNGFRKETMRFGIFVIFGIFGMDIWQMHRQTMAVLHICSGFPTKIMEQMIVTSLYDVTRFSHAIERGNYKRGA